MWQFRCTYTHAFWSGLDEHGIMSDLVTRNELPTSRAARKPRRRSPKNGGNGSFGGVFEHLYTSVSGVGTS